MNTDTNRYFAYNLDNLLDLLFPGFLNGICYMKTYLNIYYYRRIEDEKNNNGIYSIGYCGGVFLYFKWKDTYV